MRLEAMPWDLLGYSSYPAKLSGSSQRKKRKENLSLFLWKQQRLREAEATSPRPAHRASSCDIRRVSISVRFALHPGLHASPLALQTVFYRTAAHGGRQQQHASQARARQ